MKLDSDVPCGVQLSVEMDPNAGRDYGTASRILLVLAIVVAALYGVLR